MQKTEEGIAGRGTDHKFEDWDVVIQWASEAEMLNMYLD